MASPIVREVAELPHNVRECHAYREGKIAFRELKNEDMNPYPSQLETSLQRIAWFTGFFDARTNHKFGALFARFGLTFPIILFIATFSQADDKAPPKDTRPVVYMWTMKPCVHCETAKKDLGLVEETKKVEPTLPFRIEMNPPFDPDYDNDMRPFFQWKTPQGSRARYGWNGLDKFKAHWEKTMKKGAVT